MPDDRRRRLTLIALAVGSVVAVGGSLLLDAGLGGDGDRSSRAGTAGAAEEPVDSDDGEPDDDPQPDGQRWRSTVDTWADPAGFRRPYPDAALEGLLTFRGNPSRSYHGAGPVPRAQPQVLHRYPGEPMCRSSTNLGETRVWCGMGWTGQPLVFDRDGRRWVAFGAYDGHVHFMDGVTAEPILPSVPTNDLIKGTGTVDPDGYPLLYIGSRDNKLRVIAYDRPGQAEVLWSLDAYEHTPTLWNDDWDSSPIVLGDYLLEGGENSRWYVIKLNRALGPDGLVTVAPEVVFTAPSWDDELLAALPDSAVSVENSIAVAGDVAYFANSGGLVQGWDLSPLEAGGVPERVFRFWAGDDIDASIVVDEDGFLYVGAEFERGGCPACIARAREVGQLFKLDPSRPDDPLVWSVNDDAVIPGGIWGTPAVLDDVVIVGTNGGRLLAVDRDTGAMLWEKRIPGPVWGSPAVVDDVLVIGDCAGVLHGYDLADPRADPPQLWEVELGGCIEATPAVWDGRIYVGTRAGHLFVLGDPAHVPEVRPAAEDPVPGVP